VRVVFFGTPQVAVPSLEALASAGHELPLVITQPDRPSGRSRRPTAPPVKQAAQALDIEVRQPTRLGEAAFLDGIRELAPDFLAVVAFGRILRKRLLELPRRGAVNVHFSLLPKYRGAAPVQWALARGERTTGVTTMRIDEGLDEGDLLLQEAVPIENGERAPALQSRLAEIGARLLVETLERLEQGTLQGRPQDHDRATHAPILSVSDGDADPAWSAAEMEGRIRGFDPWPGLWLRRKGRRVRILDGRALDEKSPEPSGTVIGSGDHGACLVCGAGTVLQLLRVQVEGGRPMSVREARNGRQILPGDVLRGSKESP
jgi:methionyl-tRNA formyltransferase